MDLNKNTAQWYYGAGSDKKGPYSTAQLAALVESGAVTAQTLVWADGMDSWQPLAQTPLAAEFGSQLRNAPAMPAYGAGAGVGYADPAAAFGGGVRPVPRVTFIDAISICFKKYVTFSGRATRSEYWFFFLFVMIGSFACGMVDGLIAAGSQSAAGSVGIVGGLFTLAILLPSISVAVRRLHDTGRSGWMYWIALIPLVGGIILLVFFCQRSEPNYNRYG